MRLEEDEQTTSVPQRSQRRSDLGGMMSVVVIHLDASGLPAVLEPARRAAELCEHACGFITAHSRQLECSERRGCVAPVVLAGNRQRSVVRVELLSVHDLWDV